MIGLRDIAEAFGITATIGVVLVFAALLWARWLAEGDE